MAGEPATLWPGFGIPAEQTPARSAEIRNAMEAIARTFLTSDAGRPSSPRDGMIRALNDGGNYRLQFRIGGDWQNFLQHIEDDIPAPAKLVLAQFAAVPSTVWVVDHNLGSKPMAQVFDTSYNMLRPVPSGGSEQQVYLGAITPAVLTGLPAGVTTLRPALPLSFGGTFVRAHAVQAEGVVGPVVGTITFELSGAGGPMVGGGITLAAGTLGGVLAGVDATGNNAFAAGDSLAVRASMTTAPLAGFLELWALMAAGPQTGEYTLQHITDNRLVITHPAPTAGFVILVG